ncbi:MAG: hypothetical protein KJ626_00350 [Verrucomicrobia bacterium]|nr:hypothetical protein [Verrucomicrobiota bacterium]
MKRALSGYLAACVTLVAVLSSSGADPASRLEVYSLGTGDAESAKEAVEAMLGDGADVIVDRTGRLMVIGTDQDHAKVADLVDKLTVRPVNVRIDVQFLGSSSSSRDAAGVSGGGSVIVRNGKVNSSFVLKPELESRKTTLTENVGQQLMVMSGRQGFLQVGERVPYIDWLVDYGYHGGYYSERIMWENVGSYLVVEPLVLGDGPMIRIRLTPELKGLVDGNPYRVSYSKVATEVVVNDGESLRIGGSAENREFYSRFLVGVDASSRQKALDILLTPHIIKPSAR